MNRIAIGVAATVLGIGLIVLIAGVRKGQERPPVSSPASSHNTVDPKTLHRKAQALAAEGRWLEAKQLYRQLIESHPDYDQIAQAQKELEAVWMKLLFSPIEVPGKTVMYEVKSGDTLGKIAKQFNTTVEFIKKSNNLKSDVIRVGQRLRIWKGDFNILIDKSQNILILKDGNEVVKVYPVATGENNSTPTGTFKIITKLENPTWFNKGIVIQPDSPENALGTRWLGFDLPGYGIHGTIEPETIGKQVSAGCVRMLNSDVEELYSIVPYGTKVAVVD